MKVDTLDRIFYGWTLLLGLSFIVNGCGYLLDLQLSLSLWDESLDILAIGGSIFTFGIVLTQPRLAKILWDERYKDKVNRSMTFAFFLLFMFFVVLIFINHQDQSIHLDQVRGGLFLSIGAQLLYVAVSEFMGK